MARSHGGTLNAEHLLRRPSSQEALSLDQPLQPGWPSQQDSILLASRPSQISWLWRWWQRHVCISTSHDACRDHFANERTALAYFRTAQALAMMGVILAQLMRLQHSPSPDPFLGFFVVSVPLSCLCHVAALITTCLTCYRFFQWQATMARGQATSGGYPILLLFILTFSLLVAIFLLVTIISIRRSD